MRGPDFELALARSERRPRRSAQADRSATKSRRSARADYQPQSRIITRPGTVDASLHSLHPQSSSGPPRALNGRPFLLASGACPSEVTTNSADPVRPHPQVLHRPRSAGRTSPSRINCFPIVSAKSELCQSWLGRPGPEPPLGKVDLGTKSKLTPRQKLTASLPHRDPAKHSWQSIQLMPSACLPEQGAG